MGTESRAPRYDLVLPVFYRPIGNEEWYAGTSQNISRSGLIFSLNADLEIGSKIEVHVVFHTNERLWPNDILCTGEVVRKAEEEQPKAAVRIGTYKWVRPEAAAAMRGDA
jgi:hypothetical protein